MAERVVDMAAERLQAAGGRDADAPWRRARRRSSAAAKPVDDVDAFAARLRERWPRLDAATSSIGWSPSTAATPSAWSTRSPPIRCWASAYDPALPVTRAEVEYAMREEMALTLEDFLERRSRLLLWEPDIGRSVADGVARAMGAQLGWDATRVRDEAQRYRELAEHLQHVRGERAERRRSRMAEAIAVRTLRDELAAALGKDRVEWSDESARRARARHLAAVRCCASISGA